MGKNRLLKLNIISNDETKSLLPETHLFVKIDIVES